jgi:hypothetical protein
MPELLMEARAKLREQLDWRGPNDRPQGILTLTRAEAEAILAGPTEPVAVLDEIMRLAALLSKEQVESCSDQVVLETRICTSGKRIPVGKRCPHCGAKPAGEECRL